MNKITETTAYQNVAVYLDQAKKWGEDLYYTAADKLTPDSCSKILLDPREQGQQKRLQIAETASETKLFALGMGACFAVALIVSVVAAGAFSYMAALNVLLSLGGIVLSHEIYQVSSNLESLMSGIGIFGNLTQRVSCAWSRYKLANDLLKDTWFFEKLFRPWVQREIGHTLQLDRLLFILPVS